ncbi:MAG: SLBB domain-containing protein [Aestuariibacter sp.]
MLQKRFLNIKTVITLLCLLIGLLFSSVQGQTPTAQQIEQFKKLTPQQQQALAQQMGLDLQTIQRKIQGQSTTGNTQAQQQNSIYPRGTEFDQFGNPMQFNEPIDKFLEIEKQEIKPFGYELFSGAPSTFAPTFDTPVPANYILGPGDTIDLQLYGKENYNYTLTIDREGMLTVPSLEPFKLAGLTFSEAKSFVSSQIKQNMLGVESHLSMGELRSIRIFVLGEAYKPGAYTVSSLTTITQALFLTGGVSEIASLRNIQLKRAGETVQTLDLYDLLNKGDTSDDALLQPGDVVFIPTLKETITVKGKVRRPAIYELKGKTDFANAIEMAGGFASGAFDAQISVQRIVDGSVSQITVSTNTQHKPVKNGDVIEVSGVSDTVDQAVTFVGAVARPGNFQWRENVTLSDFINDKNKDLLTETDLSYGLVLRNYRTGENLSVLQFAPSKLLKGDKQHDLALTKEDIVVFFSQIETKELGKQSIEELALTKDELENLEKESWKKRIEQRMFWQQIGFDSLSEGEKAELNQDEVGQSKSPLIKLTELEKETLSELQNATEFSRKRLLAPIIENLRVHASFDSPLKIVEISGSVRYPGLYPLPDNGTLIDIFIAAGGLSESAYAHQSELTRYSSTGNGALTVQNITFVPEKIVAGEDQMPLYSRDRINVYRNPEWQEQLQVELKGEVYFPGKYTIKRGETLSSVIQRAGGLTEYADPNASIFLRESLKSQEAQNLRRLTEELRKEIASEGLRSTSGSGSLVSYSEVQKLLKDLTDVEAVGRLVIDLPKILANNDAQDFALEDGDTLVVPGVNKTVNVIGEVYVPTSHLYDEGLDFDEYIDLSGGFKNFAAEDRAYVIKANGSVIVPNRDNSYWYQSSKDVVRISPGDTIVVPYDSGYVDDLTLWTSASQIAYQLAVTIAALGSL